MTYSNEEFKEKLKQKRHNQIVALEPYQGNKTPIKFECLVCHTIRTTTPKSIMQSKHCRTCLSRDTAKKQHQLSKDEFQTKVDTIWGKNNYQINSNAIYTNQKVNVTHISCGHTWDILGNNLLRKHGCPICQNKSTGETLIQQILTANHIQFQTQKFVEINNEKHFFDFYIPSQKLWIEYDGIQHYLKTHPWYNHQRDLTKNEYVKTINEHLLRIPYTIDSIESIIEYINVNTELKISKTQVDMATNQPMIIQRNIIKYYQSHTIKKTIAKFKISQTTLFRICKRLDFQKSKLASGN